MILLSMLILCNNFYLYFKVLVKLKWVYILIFKKNTLTFHMESVPQNKVGLFIFFFLEMLAKIIIDHYYNIINSDDSGQQSSIKIIYHIKEVFSHV